jgi:hypothetical protein
VKGVISGSLDWLTAPDAPGSVTAWGAGLLIILALSFGWAVVVKRLTA